MKKLFALAAVLVAMFATKSEAQYITAYSPVTATTDYGYGVAYSPQPTTAYYARP